MTCRVYAFVMEKQMMIL